jgi:hypothetical protein
LQEVLANAGEAICHISTTLARKIHEAETRKALFCYKQLAKSKFGTRRKAFV